MKLKLHWALLCALALPSFVSGADEEAKNAARVKWARGVLTDFWDAMASCKFAAADGLISQGIKEGAKPSTGTSSFSESLVECRNGRITGHTIASEQVDPDGGEVRFEGEVFQAGGRVFKFTARVAREGAAGKWSIRYLVVESRDQPAKQQPK